MSLRLAAVVVLVTIMLRSLQARARPPPRRLAFSSYLFGQTALWWEEKGLNFKCTGCGKVMMDAWIDPHLCSTLGV